MSNKTEWFQHWFDTPYYHTLYNHRNDEEAEFFMKNLITFLKLKNGDKILDLPCGKGRHAIFLNKQGFDVVGADLSNNSIRIAKTFETKTLRFTTHDMRKPLLGNYNAIFNLFTSFGYFEDEQTNIDILTNLKRATHKDGAIVIDFLNITKTENNLVAEQTIVKEGISFLIKKNIDNNFLVKDIYFNADGEAHHFTEKLQYLNLEKLKYFAQESGLKVAHIFGDYSLSSFDKEMSDRLILILK